jgi:hypothetical protein
MISIVLSITTSGPAPKYRNTNLEDTCRIRKSPLTEKTEFRGSTTMDVNAVPINAVGGSLPREAGSQIDFKLRHWENTCSSILDSLDRGSNVRVFSEDPAEESRPVKRFSPMHWRDGGIEGDSSLLHLRKAHASISPRFDPDSNPMEIGSMDAGISCKAFTDAGIVRDPADSRQIPSNCRDISF